MTAPLKIRFLVEGPDDVHVVGQLILATRLLGEKEFDFIERKRDEGGYSWLLAKLPGQLENSRDERIVVIVDADHDPESRLREVCAIIKRENGVIDATLDVSGSIGIAPNGQPIGVWLMPNHGEPGVLEDAFASLVRGDPLWTLAQQTVRELPQPWRFKTHHKIKADVHTWLAWQEDPGRPMGVDIKANPARTSSPAIDAFIAFVEELLKRNRS